jgi:hypothetical protein
MVVKIRMIFPSFDDMEKLNNLKEDKNVKTFQGVVCHQQIRFSKKQIQNVDFKKRSQENEKRISIFFCIKI